MGCGVSRESLEGLDKPLDFRMDKLDVQEVDGTFKSLGHSIKELEEIREAVVDKYDDVLEVTGACAYSRPNTYKSGVSLLWKLSADNNGNIAKAQVESTDNEPYIVIKGSASNEGLAAGKKFINYCNDIIRLTDKLAKVFEELNDQAKGLAAGHDDLSKQISDKYVNNPMQM